MWVSVLSYATRRHLTEAISHELLRHCRLAMWTLLRHGGAGRLYLHPEPHAPLFDVARASARVAPRNQRLCRAQHLLPLEPGALRAAFSAGVLSRARAGALRARQDPAQRLPDQPSRAAATQRGAHHPGAPTRADAR